MFLRGCTLAEPFTDDPLLLVTFSFETERSEIEFVVTEVEKCFDVGRRERGGGGCWAGWVVVGEEEFARKRDCEWFEK